MAGGNHIDRAADEAGGADLLEIKIAGEIVRARRQRLQRRIEHGFDFDKGARGRRQPALDREPHPLRLVVDAVAVDAIDAQHEAVGMLAFLTQLDKACDRHPRNRIVQHRMFDHGGFHRGDGTRAMQKKRLTMKATRFRRSSTAPAAQTAASAIAAHHAGSRSAVK